MGALASGTGGFLTAPFVDRISRELGVDVHVGVGIARGVAEAAQRAEAALIRARESGTRGFAVASGESFLVLPDSGGPSSSGPASKQREDALQLMHRIVAALGADRDRGQRTPDDPYVVDTEEVAEALGTTPRTARRNLQLLSDEGLVWPLPSDRAPQPGRPRRRYRLMVERLSE
jgi:hypothetical protein